MSNTHNTHPQTTEVRSLLRALSVEGWEVYAADDGEEYMTVNTQEQTVDIVTSVDEANIYVRRTGTNHNEDGRVRLFLVLGNCPGELVADGARNKVLPVRVEDELWRVICRWSDKQQSS